MPAIRNAFTKTHQARLVDHRVAGVHSGLYGCLQTAPQITTAVSLQAPTDPVQESALPIPSAQSAASGTSRRRRNTDRPPRPRNAFIIFRSNFLVRERQSGPQRDQNDISVRAATAWNNLSKEEKRPWQLLADQEKADHHRRFPNYDYTSTRPARAPTPATPVVKRLSPSKLKRRAASRADSQVQPTRPQIQVTSWRHVKMEDILDRKQTIIRSSPSTTSSSSLSSSSSTAASPKTPALDAQELHTPVLVPTSPYVSDKLVLPDTSVDRSLAWILRPTGIDEVDEQFGPKPSTPSEFSSILFSVPPQDGSSLTRLNTTLSIEDNEFMLSLYNLHIPDSSESLDLPTPTTAVINGLSWPTATALHDIPFVPLQPEPHLYGSLLSSDTVAELEEFTGFDYNFDREVQSAIGSEPSAPTTTEQEWPWDQYFNF